MLITDRIQLYVAITAYDPSNSGLYITNAAFPVFTTTFRPSLMRLRLEVPGAPDEY